MGGGKILRSRFVGNVSNQGGAVLANLGFGVEIRYSTFEANEARFKGGAVMAGHVTIVSSDFVDNHAKDYAGAVSSYSLAADGAFFGRNTTTFDGGAIKTDWGVMVNCVFSGNHASKGAALYGSGEVTNSTFWANGHQSNAGVIYAPSTLRVVNSVIWDNTGPAIAGGPGSTIDVTYTCVDTSPVLAGEGNMNWPPLFTSPEGDDGVAGTTDDRLTLGSGSLLIDAGNPDLIARDITDRDGDGNVDEPTPYDYHGMNRVSGDSVDMGAVEY